MKATYIAMMLLAGVALAGCGGSSSSSSGGNTPAASKVTITTENQTAVAGLAFNAASQNMGKSYAASAGGVQTSTNASEARILFKAADRAKQRMLANNNSTAFVTGVPITNNCLVNGSYTYDTDNLTYWHFTDNNCEDSAGFITNGTINIDNVSSTTSTFNADLAFNYYMTANGTTVSLVGGFSLSETGVGTATRTDSMTGTSMAISAGTATFSQTNFSFAETYNNDGSSPIITSDNTSYTVGFVDTANTAYNWIFSFATTNGQPIVTNSLYMYPISGQFVVTGDASTQLRVTFLNNPTGAASGSVQLELSSDNGASWSTPTVCTWSGMAAGGC